MYLIVNDPNNGKLKVKLENPQDVDYTFVVYDRNGQVVVSRVLPKSHKMFEVNFDLESHPDGLYYLSVTGGSETWVRQIVKNWGSV